MSGAHVYIDGYNFYCGINKPGWLKYGWCNFSKLSERLAHGAFGSSRAVDEVRCYPPLTEWPQAAVTATTTPERYFFIVEGSDQRSRITPERLSVYGDQRADRPALVHCWPAKRALTNFDTTCPQNALSRD